MPVKAKKYWLFCYDITCPRRLARVARLARDHGASFQYSVWLMTMDNAGLDIFLQQIQAVIDERKDDIRCYPVSVQTPCICGRQILPEGVFISAEALPWQPETGNCPDVDRKGRQPLV